MKPSLIACSSDGSLYDTATPGWHERPPLRLDYAYPHHIIGGTDHLRSSLRYGDYAWPGGYARYYLCMDGEPLCAACVRGNYREVSRAIRTADDCSGWFVIACVVCEDTDTDESCAHCGRAIAEL